MALNSTISPVAVPVNTSVASGAEYVTEKKILAFFYLSGSYLDFGFSCYFCCYHHKLVPYLRKKFRMKRPGRRNRRIHFGRNYHHKDYVDIPVRPLRRASSTPGLSDRLSPENRHASRHGARANKDNALKERCMHSTTKI
ncbi:hypothetical protein CEXT_347071 [Caerostris extrusa]|uniref:Uncharacterized protein n=1 Tax=Caerostris extrusa TaxID=172846 RepID=A0AAV4V0A3_CAEEX|nr:hypothetical protein CEXT_347071 [Caerostris extrusa]